jgi:hypothetical protein
MSQDDKNSSREQIDSATNESMITMDAQIVLDNRLAQIEEIILSFKANVIEDRGYFYHMDTL